MGWSATDVMEHDLRAFEEGLPVRLIATPRRQLETCRADQALASVNNANLDFDFLPVVTGGGGGETIVGLLDLTNLRQGDIPNCRVEQRMDALSEHNLLGADASILAFARSAATRPCRLVVSGDAVTGIVTLSDLQKLPVRAAIFALITHLEMLMAEYIRKVYVEDTWLEHLSVGRKRGLAENIARSKRDDAFVDAILFTQLCDKRTILSNTPRFAAHRRLIATDFRRVETLRNDLAHGNDYIFDQTTAQDVSRTVAIVDRWVESLLNEISSN